MDAADEKNPSKEHLPLFGKKLEEKKKKKTAAATPLPSFPPACPI